MTNNEPRTEKAMCAMNTPKIHKFEQAGLGKAPFAFVGQSESVFVACPGAPAQPGSTCDYCGQAIRHVFSVRSADGKLFKVGCECIRKSGDSGLIRIVNDAEAAKRREKNDKRRKQRQAQRIADEAADKKLCEEFDLSVLADQPHPNHNHAAAGRTLADWAAWMRDNRYFTKLASVIRRNRVRPVAP